MNKTDLVPILTEFAALSQIITQINRECDKGRQAGCEGLQSGG